MYPHLPAPAAPGTHQYPQITAPTSIPSSWHPLVAPAPSTHQHPLASPAPGTHQYPQLTAPMDPFLLLSTHRCPPHSRHPLTPRALSTHLHLPLPAPSGTCCPAHLSCSQHPPAPPALPHPPHGPCPARYPPVPPVPATVTHLQPGCLHPSSDLPWAGELPAPAPPGATGMSVMLAVMVGYGGMVPRDPTSVASGPVTGHVSHPCWAQTSVLRACAQLGDRDRVLGTGQCFSLASQPPALGDMCPRVTLQQGLGAPVELCRVLWARRSCWEAGPLPASGFPAALLVLHGQGPGYHCLPPSFPWGTCLPPCPAWRVAAPTPQWVLIAFNFCVAK